MNVVHVNLVTWRFSARRRVLIRVVKRAAQCVAGAVALLLVLAIALQLWTHHHSSFLAAPASMQEGRVWRQRLVELEAQQREQVKEAAVYQSWLGYRNAQLRLWALLSSEKSGIDALRQVRFADGAWEITLAVELAEAAAIAHQWQQHAPDAAIEVLDHRDDDGGVSRIRLNWRDVAAAADVTAMATP